MQELDVAFDLFDKGEFQQAEEIYLSCLRSIPDKTSTSYKAALNGLGYVKSFQGQFGKATVYYQELLEISKRESNLKEEAMALHQLGMVERMAGNYQLAADFFATEGEIWARHFPDFYVGFAANFYERGSIAIKEKKYTEATILLNQSLEYAVLAESLVAQGCAYRGMGELGVVTSQFNEAENAFQKALSAFKEAEDRVAVEEIQGLLELHGDEVSKEGEA
ncbi:tetratricopeptide repeat protein [Planomicrobium okeanokoites]|uniref:tetratricopeptide repeat protein n=1 Tax=Planomicrobium okeanokoites TaxID=244 RepID=UPI00249213F6|nr:tetratricopeptide repeat protein [Planomicrobium okeanokoites]